MSNDIIAAQNSEEVLDYLLKRRSVPVKQLGAPGPDEGQIKTILQAASRAPDHGKLCPWYFLVFSGEAREQVGEIIEWAWREQDNKAAPAKLELERERFMRAPVIVGVVSRIRKAKHPMWEQILSAGAVCQNLCLAANALGFGSNWVTEWYSYNESFRSELGLDEQDHIAGFIFLGTPAEQPAERDRPELNDLVTFWRPGTKVNKGDNYGHEGVGWPETGFDLKKQ